MESPIIVPFRWDVSRRHELGGLLEAEPAVAYEGFELDLRRCCAQVLAAATARGDADLFFVGRSPESLHDYLRGICFRTRWHDRLRMLLVSLRDTTTPRAVTSLRAYLVTLGLDPAALPHRERPVALVDLVWSGGTFEMLSRMFFEWSRQSRADWRAVRDKLQIVAITSRSGACAGEWRRLRRRVTGGGLLDRRLAANVTVPSRLWEFLGDDEAKVAESHTPDRWSDPRAAQPPRGKSNASAVRFAADLFRRARDRPERLAFIAELSRCGALRHEPVRRLATELRLGRQTGERSFCRFAWDDAHAPEGAHCHPELLRRISGAHEGPRPRDPSEYLRMTVFR